MPPDGACLHRHRRLHPAREDLRREGFTVAAIRTRGAELGALVAGMNQYRERSPPSPDIPVTVISGAPCDSGMSPRIRVYRADQARQGRHMIASASGHMVPVTEPELVSSEVRRMVAR
jgi:hypothetical protein